MNEIINTFLLAGDNLCLKRIYDLHIVLVDHLLKYECKNLKK